MAMEAVGVAVQKSRALAVARSFDQFSARFMNQPYVLTIDGLAVNTKPFRASQDFPGRGFAVMRIFVVVVVFANVEYGQLPEWVARTSFCADQVKCYRRCTNRNALYDHPILRKDCADR